LTIKEGTDWLSQNIGIELPLYACKIPEESRSQNMFNFNESFNQKNAKWWKRNVFCEITSENV
jgi:hypothetical protein